MTNPVGDDPVAAITADLNHDGYLDLVTANSYSNDISVLLGKGDGTFQAGQSFAVGVGPTGLVVGDFNGDGRLDVAVADGGNGNSDQEGVSILLGNGDGTFQAPVFYATGGYPSSVVEGDFTGSGVLDLALTIPGSDDVVDPAGQRPRGDSRPSSRRHWETGRCSRMHSLRATSPAGPVARPGRA